MIEKKSEDFSLQCEEEAVSANQASCRAEEEGVPDEIWWGRRISNGEANARENAD